MTLTKLVLPADVALTEVGDLDPDVRLDLAATAGDVVVTRPHTRTTSTVVDAKTALLLAHFREPVTIVDAVLDFCQAKQLDPRETLDAAFPTLAVLVESGALVPSGSDAARPISASLTSGTRIGGVVIEAPAHLLDDSEVFRGKTDHHKQVAIKLARPDAPRATRLSLENESAILPLIPQRTTPELIAAGHWEGRPYIVTRWVDGIDLQRAAASARNIPGPEGRREVLELGARVLAAYEALHSCGVVHGDVHPRNGLVDHRGHVNLLDFGLAHVDGGPTAALHGGVDLYQPPELLDGRVDDWASRALAEQYAVAALLYLLITGHHTHRFSFNSERMFRQVAEDPPDSFASHGIRDLPRVEACLLLALAKNPARRFTSVSDMLDSFEAAVTSDLVSARASPHVPSTRHADELVRTVINHLDPAEKLFTIGLRPPTASAVYGAAGVAYALLRMARARGDAALLIDADVWSTRAITSVADDDAYLDTGRTLGPSLDGASSLHHGAAGLHCIDALVAHALGDAHRHHEAVGAFVRASARTTQYDLMFGTSGLLVGCTLLLETLADDGPAKPLLQLGQQLVPQIWAAVPSTVIEGKPTTAMLGAAHGLCGVYASILQWCDVSGQQPPADMPKRLSELRLLAQPDGRGRRWPTRLGEDVLDDALAASWCNGSAGFVHLWALAHERWGDDEYAVLASQATWSAYETATPASADLCCGFAGRAYALLREFRHSGDAGWLGRARVLESRAVEQVGGAQPTPDLDASLWHGDLGVALLVVELQTPECAAMPLVEREGWPLDGRFGEPG